MNLYYWLQTLRLQTLSLSLASTICGSILAWQEGIFSWMIAICGSVTAILLQILSNLANDYGDYQHGTDSVNRLGATRVLSAGLLSPQAIKQAIYICTVLCTISGITLLYIAQPISSNIFILMIIIGIFSIICAITYTIGQYAYGYFALGDLVVFIFFGIVGVCGLFILQGATKITHILLPAITMGLWCTAVLNINNMRDRQNDTASKKITVAVLLGQSKIKIYHLFLIITSLILWSIFCIKRYTILPSILLITLATIHSIRHLWVLFKQPTTAQTYNQELKYFSISILLQVAYLGIISRLFNQINILISDFL